MQGGHPYAAPGTTPYGANRFDTSELHNANANLAESQRALGQVIAENQGLKTRLGDLEALLGDLSKEASKVNNLEEECGALQAAFQRCQKENQNLRDSVRIAEDELRSEMRKREAAEIATAQAEAEKRRFQSGRDDLAAQLRLANEKVREAEEEQCRAEGEAAAVKRELQSRQRTDNESGGSGDIAALQQELEVERSRTDGLVSALAKVQSEAQSKTTELKKATIRIRELEAGMAAGGLQSVGEISQASSPRTEVKSVSEGINTAPSSVASPESQQGSQEASEELRNEVGKLRRKIGVLKNSRDKLLFEVDRQSVEVEAMHAEMFAVKQELEDARKFSNYWKAHTANSVDRIEKLKDMLEESAKWSMNLQSEGPSGKMQGDLEGELMQERAFAADLDKEVKKLTLQLVDSSQQNQQLKRSWLPVLHGIESNLMQLASSAADAVD
ncbi:hypothetical protein BSKO_09745 [Bryopsis sp. KO-2023]|nr:hypothetical protein BSKO_09745 [Bryopsis sp. KO-2023]